MVLSCKFFVPYTALQAGFHPCERRTNCTTGNNNKQNHKTMIKKSFYEAPEAELLLVKFEESFLTGTTLTTGKSNVEIPEEVDDPNDL